jgi:N-methylhydantoinase B/oxoprolinase/acetone carboxylase alpha subunit
VILNGVKVTRFTPIAWQPGDEVVLRVPGGAGFGDPRAREPERVHEDVVRGYVSLEAARTVYGLDIQVDPAEMRLAAIRHAVGVEQG